MPENSQTVLINTSMDIETASMLDQMAVEDGFETSRSAFVRRLIRQEWARRLSQPNQLVTVEEALEFSKGK